MQSPSVEALSWPLSACDLGSHVAIYRLQIIRCTHVQLCSASYKTTLSLGLLNHKDKRTYFMILFPTLIAGLFLADQNPLCLQVIVPFLPSFPHQQFMRTCLYSLPPIPQMHFVLNSLVPIIAPPRLLFSRSLMTSQLVNMMIMSQVSPFFGSIWPTLNTLFLSTCPSCAPQDA